MLSLHPSGVRSEMRGIGDLEVNCPRDVKQIIHLDCFGGVVAALVKDRPARDVKKALLRLFCGWVAVG
jgi:hypothetical protein